MTGFDLPSYGFEPAIATRLRGAAVRRAAPHALDDDLTLALGQARAGSEAAFTVVFRAVQPGLLRYLSLLVGSEAEDVASETWAQVCRDLDRFAGDMDGFRGWVATIGRHRALDHLRAAGRRPSVSVPTDELHGRHAANDTAADAIESLSTSAALHAISQLPPDQAEAVMLRAVLGLDAKGAAQVLGKRPGAVRMAAHRGLATLADRLADRVADGVADRS